MCCRGLWCARSLPLSAFLHHLSLITGRVTAAGPGPPPPHHLTNKLVHQGVHVNVCVMHVWLIPGALISCVCIQAAWRGAADWFSLMSVAERKEDTHWGVCVCACVQCQDQGLWAFVKPLRLDNFMTHLHGKTCKSSNSGCKTCVCVLRVGGTFALSDTLLPDNVEMCVCVRDFKSPGGECICLGSSLLAWMLPFPRPDPGSSAEALNCCRVKKKCSDHKVFFELLYNQKAKKNQTNKYCA